MASLSVVVVPASLLPVGEAQLRVVTYRPGGAWLTRTVPDAAQTRDVARELLQQVLPEDPDFRSTRLESAGVDFSGETPKIVLTAAVRMLPELADPQRLDGDTHPDWPLLAPWQPVGLAAEVIDDTRALLIAHWREQLERTTAAFDFLPRYFTTAQVRAIYSSIWGEAQNDGNFHRWLHPKLNAERICKPAPAEMVRSEVETRLAAGLRTLSDLMPTVMGAASGMAASRQAAAIFVDSAVGISPRRMGPMALAVPAVAAIGAVVGGAVAYQSGRSAGKQPVWYEREDAEREPLAVWYAPKPAKLVERPTFIE